MTTYVVVPSGDLSASLAAQARYAALGVAEGTAFPASPVTNQKFYRTDRNIQYYYDGTRWLSTQLFTVATSALTTGVTVDTGVEFPIPFLPVYDVWLVSWDTVFYRNAAGEWDIILQRTNASNVQTTIDTQDGSGDATTTYVNRQRSLGVLLQASTTKAVRIVLDEISGTATFIGAASVHYRLVG